MDKQFKGWDQGFNVMVLRMAELTNPTGYDIGPDAPTSLEALNEHIVRHKRIKVSDAYSDLTIFGDPEVNYACRAWHDWTHWRYQIPFTLAGEHEAFARQVEDMLKVYGHDAQSARWIEMLKADIIGQSEYEARNGSFPVDQFAFNRAFMLNPEAALSAQF